MSKQRKVGENWNGSTTYFKEEDGVVYTSDIRDKRQVQALLDQNAKHRSLGRDPNKAARGRIVASVPPEVHYMWKKDWQQKYADKWSWQTYLAMKLNDRNYAHFRTNDMRV